MMATTPGDWIASAREFYRERLREAFRHTGMFAGQVQREAESVADTQQFESTVREYAAGTLDATRRVGDMVMVLLEMAPNAPGPWWRDLCSYDRGFFLQLATSQPPVPANRPRRGVSALCTSFKWNMPELIKRLEAGEVIGADLQQPVTLIFARGSGGMVHVVKVAGAVERVFRATNGLRTVDQIAAAAELPAAQVKQILGNLGEIGAVIPAKSADEIMQALRDKGSI